MIAEAGSSEYLGQLAQYRNASPQTAADIIGNGRQVVRATQNSRDDASPEATGHLKLVRDDDRAPLYIDERYEPGDDRRYVRVIREPEAVWYQTAEEWERSDEGSEVLRNWLVAAFQIGTPHEPPDLAAVPDFRRRLLELRADVERGHAARVARQAAREAAPAWAQLWERAHAGSVIDQLQASQHRAAMYRRFRGVRAL